MRIVEQTLRAQMELSDREIEKRKALFDLTDSDAKILHSCRSIIMERLDSTVDEFYARQISDPETALLIGDVETLTRLKGAMRIYILELFGGVYDEAYINSRLRVGMVHWRIGVTPKYFLSALRRLHVALCSAIEEALDNPIEIHARKEAILKILFFDFQLVFDTYINALSAKVNVAKEEADDYAKGLEEQVTRRTKQLRELSLTDELTDVNNKRAFTDHAKREMSTAQRTKTELALLFIDINDFKLLNDTLGHQAGDDLLVNVAQQLRTTARETDVVCRIGGDEFCVLLPNTGYATARKLAERFADLMHEEAGVPVGASVGIAATGPTSFCTVEELLKASDESMYRAKQRNKKMGQPGMVCIDEELEPIVGSDAPTNDDAAVTDDEPVALSQSAD